MKNETMIPHATPHWRSRAQEEFIEMEDHIMIKVMEGLIKSKEEDIKRCKIQIDTFKQKIRALEMGEIQQK